MLGALIISYNKTWEYFMLNKWKSVVGSTRSGLIRIIFQDWVDFKVSQHLGLPKILKSWILHYLTIITIFLLFFQELNLENYFIFPGMVFPGDSLSAEHNLFRRFYTVSSLFYSFSVFTLYILNINNNEFLPSLSGVQCMQKSEKVNFSDLLS